MKSGLDIRIRELQVEKGRAVGVMVGIKNI